MLSQRIMQQTARRLGSKAMFTNPKFMSPAASLLQVRTAAISNPKATSQSNQTGMEILVAQRLARPVAPHLTIYRPQVGWILSSLHRITGVTLSGTLYLFAIAYLAAPMLGLNMGSTAIAAALAKWSLPAKVALKFPIAMTFAFKCLNGTRHLVWDTGRALTNPQVIRSGWTVVGLSVVSALALSIFV